MKIINCEQGTEEWFSSRLGVPSASNLDKILNTKGSNSKQYLKYMYQLVGESVRNTIESSYKTDAMQRGNDLESEARSLYEILTGNVIDQVGFCLNEDPLFGCSPDGLIGEDGGLEIKCPLISTHIDYLIGGEAPREYYPQVQGNLFVTGRKWWDFMSYSPNLKPLIVRVFPDKEYHELIKENLIEFNNKIKEIKEKIK